MKHLSIALLSFLAFYFLSYTMYKLVHSINWNDMTSFKIYEFKFDKPADSLTNAMLDTMEYTEADPEEARRVLKQANKLVYSCYVWKGKKLAVATFKNGVRRKILISNYGGFFLDVEYNCFYEFKGGARKEWNLFLQRSLDNCTVIEQYS